ncbi:bicyclomycin resistance protein [Spongiactinospora gelatinilytica]|uniref:Bicyclomycin resistance protein n=1 Tax=Spongiactinospora gelatinilytica TaxID=2666298 RepID=A0A2W2HAR3_9ACTN|nr:extracellular solute-binding protein [Spongiactinospora gelatinilytica]PZG51989.1 bicyclomycin resistance protein [Spongiactinospora gelatinilytica]
MPGRAIASACSLILAGLLAGCGGGEGRDDSTITVWTEENLPDRMAAQRVIAADFTKRTGIKVDLVGVAEDQFSQVITAAAAASELPDVIGALPLASVRELEADDLLDLETPGAVMEELGRDTFIPRALELNTADGRLLAVPSDAWAQLVLYRKDLFAKAGLEPPRTLAGLLTAARALNRDDMAGITLAVSARDSFTAQSFEHVALANGCQMIDGRGAVALDSPACVRAFQLYGELARNFSVPGKQDVDTTRATYFSGRAAMTIWSSFVLDELAGLRRDTLPSCAECRADPEFLAENTGVVTALSGPDSPRPAQYGEIVSWAVTREADKDAARSFVTYMMSDGYERWFGMAPEGKVPVREGYADAWSRAPAGVDGKRPLSEVYPKPVLDALRTSPETFSRWGIPQGQGKLVGAAMGELPVPKALNGVVTGSLTPQQAAAQARRDVEAIKRGLRQ